jgi:hypothetical protein
MPVMLDRDRVAPRLTGAADAESTGAGRRASDGAGVQAGTGPDDDAGLEPVAAHAEAHPPHRGACGTGPRTREVCFRGLTVRRRRDILTVKDDPKRTRGARRLVKLGP